MNVIKIDGIEYNLQGIEKDCWLRMLNGSIKAKKEMQNATIANVNKHGVGMRTVVLRKVDTINKQLFFYTDIRSGKCKELIENPNISWHFYNDAKVQIRLAGIATIETTGLKVEQAWQKSSVSSRKAYMGMEPPTLKVQSPQTGLPVKFSKILPTIDETEIGKKNFAVVTTQIHWMEWLYLGKNGHARAMFMYKGNNITENSWLLP